MIKPHVLSQSIEACPKEILEFIVRGYKYLHCVNQFKEDEDLIDFFVLHFAQKLRKTKVLRKITLKTISPSFDAQIKSNNIKSLLKSHSQDLQSLDVSDLSCLQSSSHKKILIQAKNLKKLQIRSKKAEIKDLQALTKLKGLSIDTRDADIKISDLYKALTKLRSLRTLELSSYQGDFNETLKLLDQITTIQKKALDIRIKVLKGDETYENLPDINNNLKQMITELKLSSITTTQPFYPIFKNHFQGFQNLKALRLEFSSSDPSLAICLKTLEYIPLLENLCLNISEANSKEFSAAVINNLRLPYSLQDLELVMPLSLEDYILNNRSLIIHAKERLAWREKNYFEEEPSLKSFFKMFENTKLLRKLMFEFKMLDSFSSYYTSFFVCVLNKLPQLQSFALCIKDCANPKLPNELPEDFDLALLLESCSKMKDLQGLEVAVPNLLFEDIEISSNLSQLKEFHISVTDPEDNELTQENKPLKFTNISKFIKKLLKDLVAAAPNLRSLIINIGEVMDDSIFCERFKLITEFKNLESLYLQFLILSCKKESAQIVGRYLQSMKKLKGLVLQFNESDPNAFMIKDYINYHKSIKDILLVSSKEVWLGDAGCVKKI